MAPFLKVLTTEMYPVVCRYDRICHQVTNISTVHLLSSSPMFDIDGLIQNHRLSLEVQSVEIAIREVTRLNNSIIALFAIVNVFWSEQRRYTKRLWVSNIWAQHEPRS